MIAAAANGHVAVIEDLLRAGAVVDHVCSAGTAMDVAVTNGHVSVVKRLIAAGADVTRRNAGGWTYLMQATVAVQPDVIPVLVEAGCPLEATRAAVGAAFDDADRQTALMMAAAWDPCPTRALIRAGAEVNARDAAGATPLMHAVKGAVWTAQNGRTTPGKWDPSIVALLLKAGANPNSVDAAGHTPFQLAAKSGENAMVVREMLRKAGAR
jgi:ankyrin repeat protein